MCAKVLPVSQKVMSETVVAVTVTLPDVRPSYLKVSSNANR